MKKLMIAAAAAAMIGGAFADTLVYDFTANLKTTTGKASKVETTTYNLGWDGDETFWYQDKEFTDLPAEVRTTKVVDGDTLPAFKVDAKGFVDVSAVTNDAAISKKVVAALEYLSDTYDQKSAGVWCQSVKATDSACYRVSATKKIKKIYTVDDCCGGTFADADEDAEDLDATFQRFGAIQSSKATKVEAYVKLADLIGCGQGTWKAKLYKQYSVGEDEDPYVAGVSSISGNIVGVLPAPNCQSCCKTGEDAVAFECDSVERDEGLETYAFGTWSLKFNSSKTKKLAREWNSED